MTSGLSLKIGVSLTALISQGAGGAGGAASPYETSYMGPKGLKTFAVSVWCQTVDLHPVWKSRGVLIMHTDFAEFANNYAGLQNGLTAGDAWNKSISDNGLFQARRPQGPNYGDLGTDQNGNPITYQDYRTADKNNDHVLWWPIRDEPEQEGLPIEHYESEIASWETANPTGVLKHTQANYNGGNVVRQQSTYRPFLNSPKIDQHSEDVYPRQAYKKSYLGTDIYSPGWFVNAFFYHGDPTLTPALPGTLHWSMAGPIIMKNGPYNGEMLACVGKPVLGNVGTGRVDLNMPFSDGKHPEPRFTRQAWWLQVIAGVCGLNFFPQTPSTISGTGSITGNSMTITSMADLGGVAGSGNKLFAPLRIYNSSNQAVGTLDVDQNSGGPGTYTISNGVTTASGTLYFNTPAFTNGDDTNAANAAETTNMIAALRSLLENHPQGGNMLMDTVHGDRAPYLMMIPPHSVEDPNLHVDDMTQLTSTTGGTQIGGVTWPQGFAAAEFTGQDGKKRRLIASYSSADSPTVLNFSPWGISNMIFGPCEVKLFDQGAAYNTTSTTNQMPKAGVDDGPQTYLGFASLTASQNEGNSGTTAYVFTVNRTGITTGTTTVNWTVTGSGSAPANAADFVGGTLPSGTLTFSAGDTSKTITVNVQGDTTFEPTEAFAVTLSGASAGSVVITPLSVATGVITNDDASSFDIATLFGGGDVGTYGSAVSLSSLKQDTAGTTAVSAVNDPVAYTADLSGKSHPLKSSYDFTNPGPGSSTTRPLFKQASGINYLSFDGVDDFLAATNYSDDLQSSRFTLPNSTGWTEFYAMRLPVMGSGKAGMVFARNSGDSRVGNYNAGQLFIDSGGHGSTQILASDGSAFDPGVAPGANTWFVLIVEHKSGTNGATMQLNNNTPLNGTIGSSDGSGLLLGAGIFAGNGQADFNTWGRIGRLLTTTEKNNLRTELGARIGLAL